MPATVFYVHTYTYTHTHAHTQHTHTDFPDRTNYKNQVHAWFKFLAWMMITSVHAHAEKDTHPEAVNKWLLHIYNAGITRQLSLISLDTLLTCGWKEK